jgi:hypothetical protein
MKPNEQPEDSGGPHYLPEPRGEHEEAPHSDKPQDWKDGYEAGVTGQPLVTPASDNYVLGWKQGKDDVDNQPVYGTS